MRGDYRITIEGWAKYIATHWELESNYHSDGRERKRGNRLLDHLSTYFKLNNICILYFRAAHFTEQAYIFIIYIIYL